MITQRVLHAAGSVSLKRSKRRRYISAMARLQHNVLLLLTHANGTDGISSAMPTNRSSPGRTAGRAARLCRGCGPFPGFIVIASPLKPQSDLVRESGGGGGGGRARALSLRLVATFIARPIFKNYFYTPFYAALPHVSPRTEIAAPGQSL